MSSFTEEKAKTHRLDLQRICMKFSEACDNEASPEFMAALVSNLVGAAWVMVSAGGIPPAVFIPTVVSSAIFHTQMNPPDDVGTLQ